MQLVKIKEEYDKPLAEIIRYNLKARGLDLPGTVYFDPELDHLSTYYQENPKRDYYIVLNEKNQVVGGIGIDDFPGLENCAELQKLYLADEVKGQGYGYELIAYIKKRAVEMGYSQMYLETHHDLEAAIHIYEKSGFQRIEKLPECVHSTMDTFFLMQLSEIRMDKR